MAEYEHLESPDHKENLYRLKTTIEGIGRIVALGSKPGSVIELPIVKTQLDIVDGVSPILDRNEARASFLRGLAEESARRFLGLPSSFEQTTQETDNRQLDIITNALRNLYETALGVEQLVTTISTEPSTNQVITADRQQKPEIVQEQTPTEGIKSRSDKIAHLLAITSLTQGEAEAFVDDSSHKPDDLFLLPPKEDNKENS